MPTGNLYPGLPGLKILSGSYNTGALAPQTDKYTTVALPSGCGNGLVLGGVVDTITNGGAVNFETDGTASANTLGLTVTNTNASTATIVVTYHAFILPGL